MTTTPYQTTRQAPRVFPGGCVVLVRPDAPSPNTLLRALESRGLSTRLAYDEPAVMSLFAERPTGRRVLIVVEPGQWQRLAELVCAVHAYHSEVLCWQYAERVTDQPRLKALDQRFKGPGPSPTADARRHDGQAHDNNDHGPIGRIVTRKRRVDALLNKVPGRPLSTREVVTQQELTMLLGPVPGEAS